VTLKRRVRRATNTMLGVVRTRLNLARQRTGPRMLEIGPGPERIAGFETLNVVPGPNVDYLGDAAKRLPFRDATFDVIYASHVVEHIPWYQTQSALREWVRVLASGGRMEVWVPNGLLICKTLVDFELTGENRIDRDGWYRFNDEKDPCKWAAGRLFTYGDGTGRPDDPNWHRAMFTPRYLRFVLESVGLSDVRELGRADVRGYDHGWINLGMTGTKP
jgi:SAM-dependent methyltransferase